MRTTPQALLPHTAYELARWKGTAPADELVHAQTLIDTLLAGGGDGTVLHHPMTEWVSDKFGVHWDLAGLAVGAAGIDSTLDGGGGTPTDPVPDWSAGTYDPDTYELQFQGEGVGTPTATHDDGLLMPDHEGVYHPIPAGDPAWHGARVVRNVVPTPARGSSNSELAWLISGAQGAGSVFTDNGDGSYNILWEGTQGTTWACYSRGTLVDQEGAVCVNRITIRAGRPEDVGQLQRVFTPNGGFTTVTLTASWVTYSFAVAVANTGNRGRVGLQAGTTAVRSVDFKDVQLEYYSDTPSEFVGYDTTKYFANENGNTVNNNVVTEATGALLPEVPSLYAGPAATNLMTHSNDATQSNWFVNGSCTFDQPGLTGEPNTATRFEDASAVGVVGGPRARLPIVTTGSATHAARVFIRKKEVDEGVWMRAHLQAVGGTTVSGGDIRFNPATGDVGSNGHGTYELVDRGLWWEVLLEVTDNGSGNGQFQLTLYAAFTLASGASQDVAATGAQTMGNLEVYDNTTIDKLRGSPPIITEGATVSIGETYHEWGTANVVTAQGCYLAEVKHLGTSASSGQGFVLRSATNASFQHLLFAGQTSNRFHHRSRTSTAFSSRTGPVGENDNEWHKVACTFSIAENKLRAYRDISPGPLDAPEVAYAGLNWGAINLRATGAIPVLYRSIQAYDLPYVDAVELVEDELS